MDHIWQWTWDRYKARYSWALCAVMFAVLVPAYLVLSFLVVACEDSDRYVEAALVTVAASPLMVYLYFLPGLGPLRLVEQWAAGRDVDRRAALDARVEQLTKITGDALLAPHRTHRRGVGHPTAGPD